MHRYFLFTRKAEAKADALACRDNPGIILQEENSEQLAGKEALPVKPDEENIYEQLLAKGYSKQSIHKVFHYFILEEIKNKKATGSKHKPIYEKPSLFAKESHFLKSLISAAVSFIKTQFAKKPKNPV